MKILSVFVFFAIFQVAVFDASGDESDQPLSRQERAVFFPQFSTLQLSMCLVAQISSIPTHKVAINTGFQINYGLPFRLKDFYSPIYWARSFSNVSTPLLNFIERMAQDEAKSDDDEVPVEEDSESNEDVTENEVTEESETTTEKPKRKRKPKVKREIGGSDLTAGQFYSGLTDAMSYGGYHEDCLLKSVCELAQHPLHPDDDNVVFDVINFILTPSVHQSFDSEAESYEKQLYEEAEEMGKSGRDCELIYGEKCRISPLHRISRFIHPSSDI